MKKPKLEMTFSRRDILILLVFVCIALGFAWWTMLISPKREDTARLRTEMETLEAELITKKALLPRLAALEPEPGLIQADIAKIADRYLPENSVQYYYDLLNKHVDAINELNDPLITELAVVSVKTWPLRSFTIQQDGPVRREDNSLVAAIDEYNKATNDQGEVVEETPTSARRSRYRFNYIDIEYNVAEGNFAAVQEFIKSINDLNWTVYFPEATITADGEESVKFGFNLYFISIDRLEGNKDIYKYEDVPPPAGLPDIFR